eukprot:m.270313 g.270313  ORF g.270313 m.270313 type:complete len:466 (-) comp16076_c1_seq1:67-1464(-)
MSGLRGVATVCVLGTLGVGLYSSTGEGERRSQQDAKSGVFGGMLDTSSVSGAQQRRPVQIPVRMLDGKRGIVRSKPVLQVSKFVDDHALLRVSNSTFGKMAVYQNQARDWVRRLPRASPNSTGGKPHLTGVPELKWGWHNLFNALDGVQGPVVIQTAFDFNWGFFSQDVWQRGDQPRHMLCAWTNFSRNYLKESAPQRRGKEPVWAPMQRLMDDPRVRIVFASSSSQLYHPKLVMSPLGERMVGGYFGNEWGDLWKKVAVPILARPPAMDTEPVDRRDILVYSDFPNRQYRKDIMHGCLIQRLGKRLVMPAGRVGRVEHYNYMLRAKFVLSFPGMGVDCYRTWETLRAGSIPILLSGMGMEGLMTGLPVLWVKDYIEVTAEMLERAYPEIIRQAHTYDYSRTTSEWWTQWFSKMDADPSQTAAFLREFSAVPRELSQNYSYALTQRWVADVHTECSRTAKPTEPV